MKIETLAGGYDKNFTYVVACEETGKGLVIDAAVPADEITGAAERLGCALELLVLTHSHGDHTPSARELLSRVPGMRMAAFGREAAHLAPDDRFRELADGDTISVGAIALDILHTPGHYPDSICLVGPPALFTGDTLFVGRTGRTIGPRSDTRALYHSVCRLLPLDDALVIYSGHDYGPTPTDTLGNQKATNPFLGATSEDDFVRIMAEYEASR